LKTLIIGVAGTGKSYLVREMRRKGFNAIDVDKGLATFVDKEGNEARYEGGAKWWQSHYYILKRDKLQKLLTEQSLYLFGDVGGQPGRGNGLVDVAHLFDRVCYLKAPQEMIRRRLAERADNPFGKKSGEVEGTMKHKAKMDRIARKMKFDMVNATLPTEQIIQIVTGSGASRV
jgi:dephospho-CoA kinase